MEIDCDPPFSFDQTVLADRSRDSKAPIHRSIQLVGDNDKLIKCRDYSTGATAIATVKGVSVDAPPELAPFVRLYFAGRPPSTVRKAMEKLGFSSKEVVQLLERCEGQMLKDFQKSLGHGSNDDDEEEEEAVAAAEGGAASGAGADSAGAALGLGSDAIKVATLLDQQEKAQGKAVIGLSAADRTVSSVQYSGDDVVLLHAMELPKVERQRRTKRRDKSGKRQIKTVVVDDPAKGARASRTLRLDARFS